MLKNRKFHGKINAKLWIVAMRNFQDTFKTCKQSFIIAFSICMAVPLQKYWIKINKNGILLHIGSHFFESFSRYFIQSLKKILENDLKHPIYILIISFYISFYRELLKISVVKKIYNIKTYGLSRTIYDRKGAFFKKVILKKWFAIASVMAVEAILNKTIKYVPNVFPKTVFFHDTVL